MPEEEIGQLNFLEFDVLLTRKHLADDKLRLNAGFIYSAIYNTADGDPNREAVQPTDIVPSMREDKTPDLTKMTGEEQRNFIFHVFMGAGKRSMR